MQRTTRLSNKKTNTRLKMKQMNKHLTKENIQVANKHMKRFLASLVIKEMPAKIKGRIETTITYLLK